MSKNDKGGLLAVLILAFCLAGVFAYVGGAAADPADGKGAAKKADLVIMSFVLKEWGKCEENKAVFTFQVVVKNAGTAPSPPIVNGLRVFDGHPGIVWGNGEAIASLPPGGTQTVTVSIPYFLINKTHMITASPHPFKAVVDPDNTVSESNEGNNESTVVNVDLKKICSR